MLHTKFCHCLPSLPVPVIDPIPTERFPEYVRDMLYGEENKLEAEFLVRSPYMIFLRLVHNNDVCVNHAYVKCVCAFPMVCV